MTSYVPFLKFKVNEIGALSTLSDEIVENLVPFFDFPRKNDMTEISFVELVGKTVRSVNKNLSKFESIYIDNFDIDDAIKVAGFQNYQYIIESFSEINFIPVVGLDRTIIRNQVVFEAKSNGTILSEIIALRLQCEDIEDFLLVQDEIETLLNAADGLFTSWTLIIDNRMCLNVDIEKRSNEIVRFISDCDAIFNFDQIIITGSSIPASIASIVPTETEITHERTELLIFQDVSEKLEKYSLTIGDYTIVSPLYSDLDIPAGAMRNVTAPKITYSFDKSYLILRGGALTSHARGSLQYNDMAKYLTSLPLYRGEPYSFGDKYLHEKASYTGSQVTPSSVLKPTINAHMTYMCRDFTI